MKKLVLESVIVGGKHIFSEQQKTMALGNALPSTFDAEEFSPEFAQKYLDGLGDFGEYSANLPPRIIGITGTLSTEDPTPRLVQTAFLTLLGGWQRTLALTH